MASKDPEEPSNTETDEETVALRKKRSRRVSFADREITSVHIFKRDEDYETPPDSSKPSSAENAEPVGPESELLGFFKDLADSDDSKDLSLNGEDEDEDDEDDVVVAAKSFLRPIESPSPGSSIVGSAASNDEDNFFGPVSASFIRPGRLSGSSASDDNHDITMDSTAFSMHFRSLAMSELGGDLKTPTGVRLAFEEKTPSQITTTPSGSGSFMVLTKAKKLVPESPLPSDKVSGGRDSNDMSLVGENPHKYDYGKLSPRLEALLAEGSKDLHAASGSNSTRSEVSAFYENGSSHKDQIDCGDLETSNLDMSAEGVSFPCSRFSEANGGSPITVIEQIAHDYSANTKENPGADASIDRHIQTPNQLNKEEKEFSRVVIGTSMVNADFPAVYSSTPVSMNSKVLQLGLFSQQEPVHRHSTEDWLRENSPTNSRLNSGVDQISAQEHGSPSAGSISLLSAKRRQIFLDTAQSSKHSSYVTPSPKQSGFFLSKESTKRGDVVPSIQKSNSKFNIIEPSPYASALKDRLEKSKLRLSEYLSSKASPFNTVLEDNMKNLQRKHLDLPITNLEEHLLSAGQKNREHKSTINMNSNDIWTTKDIGSLTQHEEIAGLAKDGESVDPMSTHILRKEKSSQIMTAMNSPARFNWSGKNVMEHLLMSENPKEGTMVISESNSSPLEIALDHRKDKKVTDVPGKFVSPLVKRLDEKLSTEYQSSLSGDLKQQGRSNKFSGIGSRQDENSIGNVTSGWSSTVVADKLNSLFVERRAQSELQAKSVDDGESYPPELQNVSESVRNFQTPPRDRVTLKFQSVSPEKNFQIVTDLTLSKGELPRVEIKAASSPYVCRSADKPSLRKLSQRLSKNELTQSPTWKDSTRSPSRIELHTASHNDNRQPFVGKDILSPQSNTDEHCNNDSHHIPQSTIPVQDIENSSRRKRRIEEMVLRDADHGDEISRIQTSAKVHKSASCDMFMLEHSIVSDNRKDKTGRDTALKHWTDITLKFSSDTNQLYSSSIDKLNIRAIGMLEDSLAYLQKVHIYEMLCSEIHSQKAIDHSSNVRHKRVAETKSLLYKIVYEKAKLQLMCEKRDRLLKKVQLLSSGIQETQMLKLNNITCLSIPAERDAQVDDNLHDSDLVNFKGKHEVASDKVTTMRHEFEAIDRKIKNLTKSFLVYCKMKGEPSCADTIVLLKNHLKQRTCCGFIRQDLQLWEVVDLESINGHHSVVLNYHGFICQRFTINVGPVSSICISNKLNDINIMKNFPNMDACTAFAFVLNAETTKKYVGSKSLAQETQSTSSLLRNLLDVVEEVQLARTEIRNLTQTSFQTPSAEQLDLQLSFIDFNCGRKVTMTLDLTCLKRGIYPSEILPYQLQAPTISTEKLIPQFLSADIKSAVESLRVGYSRIVRLCRCVSQVVRSGSR